MVGRLAKAALLGGFLTGLCLPVQANTTTPAPDGDAAPANAAVTDAPASEKMTSVALLLPLRSGTLREAAEVVRAGFQAAYEREQDGMLIRIIETDESPQDVLAGYQNASAQADIVVGPLSRSGVAAVLQEGMVTKPTIALTPPESSDTAEVRTQPLQISKPMLVMGLSIEDEARQVADWVRKEHPDKKALVLFAKSAWQRRAAKAFELHWQQKGLEAEAVDITTSDGFLNGRTLMQLKKQVHSEDPAVLFLALDARLARQVRAVMGTAVASYGTSQLNPFALSKENIAERMPEMEGTRLLDIPWQLQPDHPAVMVYPRLEMSAERKRDADMERLYALGIDAYRVAREIATQHTRFELDGVTGKLSVQLDKDKAQFARTARHAVYRDGSVVPIGEAR